MTWAAPVLLPLLSDPVSAPQGLELFSRFRALTLQPCLERPLDVFADHITLEVHRGPESLAANGGDGRRVRNDGDLEAIRTAGDDREADAVNRDRALRHDVAHQ